jgi:hypothetical protein
VNVCGDGQRRTGGDNEPRHPVPQSGLRTNTKKSQTHRNSRPASPTPPPTPAPTPAPGLTSRLQGATALPCVHTTTVAPDAARPVESGMRAGRAPPTLGPVNVMDQPKSCLLVNPLAPPLFETVTVKPTPAWGACMQEPRTGQCQWKNGGRGAQTSERGELGRRSSQTWRCRIFFGLAV